MQERQPRKKKTIVKQVNNEIENLKRKNFIRISRSKWYNPILPVIKPDGTIILCMNLMALNEITKADNQLILNVEDILNAMQGNRWFTVLDIKERYFQIHVKENDKQKTAFTINNVKYEWNRMPMGLKMPRQYFKE